MSWPELHEALKGHLQPAPGRWPKNGEYRYFCPFHEDKRHPNLDINEEKGCFICRACGKAGKLTDLARHLGLPIERRLQKDYKISDANAMWLLKKQGISSETAEFFSIKPNYKKQAWQYPIFDWRTNQLLGYRFKAYDATAERKYWETGKIGARVYFGRVDGLVTYLAEGEKDTWLLSQAGLPAACITGAATAVPDNLAEALKAQGIEEVRVAYDLDGAGREGARKVMQALAGEFTVKVLQLPKNLGKGGDIADLYRLKGDEFKETVEGLPVTSLAKRKYREADIIDKVAGDGFLRTYLGYCADSTDAPWAFHLATGLAILGAAAQNNIIIRSSYGHLRIFPCLWIVIVAPTGFFRKSTCLTLGKRLLRKAIGKALIADDWTPQRLAGILKDNPAGLLVIQEFTRLLRLFEREYMSGAKEMLTELYDSPAEFIVERQTSDKIALRDVSISLLGATTLGWLEDSVRAKDLEGGFLARFLFIAAMKRGPRPERKHDVNVHIYDRMIEHLRAVNDLRDEADFSLVRKDLEDWTWNYERLAEQGGMPSELVGMYSRTGTTVEKLALLFQLNESPPSLKVTPKAAQKAKAFIEYVHSQTGSVTSCFADDYFGRKMGKVLKYLRSVGGKATRQDVMRKTRMEAKLLDRIERTLIEQGALKVDMVKEGRGRPAKVYRVKEDE